MISFLNSCRLRRVLASMASALILLSLGGCGGGKGPAAESSGNGAGAGTALDQAEAALMRAKQAHAAQAEHLQAAFDQLAAARRERDTAAVAAAQPATAANPSGQVRAKSDVYIDQMLVVIGLLLVIAVVGAWWRKRQVNAVLAEEPVYWQGSDDASTSASGASMKAAPAPARRDPVAKAAEQFQPYRPADYIAPAPAPEASAEFRNKLKPISEGEPDELAPGAEAPPARQAGPGQ